MSSRSIGPQLLPGMERPSSPQNEERARLDKSVEPTEPAIGPVLPPHLMKNTTGFSTEASTSAEAKPESKSIGPALPPHLQQRAESESSSSESSSENEQIGPSVHMQGGDYDVKREFAERERRAEASKIAVPERESWMTELPSDRTGVKIGLGARMFTKREGTDTVLDDTWTDTPGQEKKKPKKDREAELNQHLDRKRKSEAKFDEVVELHAAKRGKPLIEMHREQDERKVKKKEKKGEKHKKDKKHKKGKKHKKDKKNKRRDEGDSEAPPARKPFNWEEDMRVSMVDTTRAKSMLDKTLLQSRFAPSKSQKYL